MWFDKCVIVAVLAVESEHSVLACGCLYCRYILLKVVFCLIIVKYNFKEILMKFFFPFRVCVIRFLNKTEFMFIIHILFLTP